MKHECSKEEIIDIVREDVKEIKGDVKTLLASKNKIEGVTFTMMFLISSAVALIAKLV